MSVRRKVRGFTLIEVLISIAILAAITSLLFGAFSALKRSKDGLTRMQDRQREARLAMARMTRELQSAYLSAHLPINQALMIQKTIFRGERGTPADRVDFTAFANMRLEKDSHVSDQCEIAYYGSPNPDGSGTNDLVRRVDSSIDLEPTKGGKVEVLATDIDLFDLQYLDAQTGQWQEGWDTTQSTGQLDRLPLQVRIILVLNGGARAGSERSRNTIRLVTKVGLNILQPLTFATL
ncbi:MAG: prepilin-type N-terminal cleavage/methylation domain-containing protein [Myxococcales bacterium]|nr:MAG: prepilin-type N-terminal cleavage/methylation domain-containing protein [Myxococcales bacterium]